MKKKKEFPVKLAAPALRAMANKKITTLQQLAEYSEKEIAALHGIGNNALIKLKAALAANGWSFKNNNSLHMPPTNKEICEAFSNGNFKCSYNFLAEDVEWNIVGTKTVKGKAAVIEFCNNTAAYFATVTTTFTMSNLIADSNAVAIDGSAQFINKENKITNVSSCDVYRFKDGLLKTITSYCIETDKT